MSEQPLLLDVPPDWKAKWKGMPDFEQQDQSPWQSVLVHFKNLQDRQEFAALVGQTVTDLTKSLWYPRAEIRTYADKAYKTQEAVNPRYPVYIISKGRWESRLTAKALEDMGVAYRIVVEPQEFDAYSKVISPEKILTLPFSNLGQGSIPARNWVWEHSIKNGDSRHWILDDNIDGFYRLNDNLKVPVKTGSTFAAIEDWVDRWLNVGIAGMNYFMFASRKTVMPPITMNTRIYSCILIRNDIPYRWRGRYNEDTDLSIRALKDGWCTALFNAFLAYKTTTMTMKGGNTDELYQGDGRLKMAVSLRDQHSDIVQITTKWGRAQHHVNYKIFRHNRLVPDTNAVARDGCNNYGMKLNEDVVTDV
jgi:hypothetical protein